MIYLSCNARPELKQYLEAKDEITLVGPFKAVDEGISCHPDILYCRMGGGRNTSVFKGDKMLLGKKYPADCRYNAVLAGVFFIHKKGISDPALLAAAGENIRFIDVPQGYTKCNIVLVDDSHLITSDKGIYKAVSAYSELNCLLVSPGHILLPGFQCGFIGGCSGRVGDEIIFNGNLEAHQDFGKIKDFIEACGLKVKYFPGWDLTDIGSIIAE